MKIFHYFLLLIIVIINWNGHNPNEKEEILLPGITTNWVFKAGNAIRSSPVYDHGILFIGSSDHFFYAINNKGVVKWKLNVGSAVCCSAAINNEILYLVTRKNTLFAVEKNSGKIIWETQLGSDLPYEWGFDYYTSSPVVCNNNIVVGSGDGNLYCIDKWGKIFWKYYCGSRVRSTATVDGDKVYFGDMNGCLYNLNLASGKVNWIFKTTGNGFKNEEFGFDRKAIIAQPVIAGKLVLFGGRDGFLYAVNKISGAQQWKFDYDVSWVLSKVAVKNDTVISTTSDGHFVHALNLANGKEIWRFMTGNAAVWAAPEIKENRVIIAANNGIVYSLNISTGKENWRYSTGEKIFSFPLSADGNVFFGNDGGNIFSIKEATTVRRPFLKAVYWIPDPPAHFHKYGTDIFIKDYFIDNSYKLVNDTALHRFIDERNRDRMPSVIVFATNYIPVKLFGDSSSPNLVLAYLQKGGKIVLTGINPGIYDFDSTGLIQDFAFVKKRMEIEYPFNDTRAYNGFYPSIVTEQGRKWGLTGTSVSSGNIDPLKTSISTILSMDESGRAACWVKNYGGRQGTGLVQTWVLLPTMQSLREILQVAEYGF